MVIERFLICVVPTLLAGRLIAAYDVPPRATNSARREVTFANVSLRKTDVVNMGTPSQAAVAAHRGVAAEALAENRRKQAYGPSGARTTRHSSNTSLGWRLTNAKSAATP